MYRSLIFVIIFASVGAMELRERPRKKDLSRLILDSVSNEGEVFSDIKSTLSPRLEQLDNHATTRTTVKVSAEGIFRVSSTDTDTGGANVSSGPLPSEHSRNASEVSYAYVYVCIGIIYLVALFLYILWFIRLGRQTFSCCSSTSINTWTQSYVRHVD